MGPVQRAMVNDVTQPLATPVLVHGIHAVPKHVGQGEQGHDLDGGAWSPHALFQGEMQKHLAFFSRWGKKSQIQGDELARMPLHVGNLFSDHGPQEVLHGAGSINMKTQEAVDLKGIHVVDRPQG